MPCVIYEPRKSISSSLNCSYSPDVDIEERADSYMISLDLPGFEKDDIHVTMEGNVLIVSGERSRKEPERSEYYRSYERPTGSFRRMFRIPDVVDAGSMKAEYRNGVLALELRKKEEAKPFSITVT